VYTADVSPDRHYHLQSEDANRRIDALLEQLRVPESTWPLYADLLTTALKMYEDGAGVADLRIANAAFKEIRYGFKVFAPWRNVPKITIFGSARTPRAHPISEQSYAFSKRITGAGWMVITGAGGGVMSSAQEGAGGERSFGLNIRLPFEQEANPWIASDPKLITFKYFFTRKLFLVKEASGMAVFPGGFGTMDEVFEVLTLMQTGKASIIPIVLVETDQTPYWRRWDAFIRSTLAEQRLIDGEDPSFYRVVDTVEDAVRELTRFYRVFHSSRIVGDHFIFRLNHALTDRDLAELQQRFEDILKGPVDQAPGPVPQEQNEYPSKPRLIVPFNRTSYARLRQLIDFVNTR
jgi:uncharacterized protein (TIGR00730 family)